MNRFFTLVSLVAISIASEHSSLRAAEDLHLQGDVVDQQNRPIDRAQVKLFRESDNLQFSTVSDASGHFDFAGLSFGRYLVNVARNEFRSTAQNVILNQGTSRKLTITLQIAGVNQSVVVTAADAAQTLNEVSKALSVVSQDEIVNRNDYAISEILRTTPGVQLYNGGGPGQDTSMRMRGLRPDATAFLVDGLRFRDSTTVQGDASSFLSALNFIDADHIEVLRGSGSSLYGTNAAGGAVNIVTDPGGGLLHGQLQVEGGNLGMFRGRGSLAGGAFHDRLRFSAGLLHLNVTAGVDGQDANRSTGLQGFVVYDFTPRSSLSGRFWGSDDFVQLNNSPSAYGVPDANIPPTGIVPARPLSLAGQQVLLAGGQPDFGTATYIPGINDPDYRRASRFTNIALVYRQILNPRLNWQTSYQRVHTGRTYNNGPLGSGYQPPADSYSNYVGDIDTADTHVTAQVTRWFTATAGYEFERERYFDHQDNNLLALQRVVERTHAQQLAHAAYFANQFALLNRQLQISLSGRAQVFRLSRPDFQYGGTGNAYAGMPLLNPPRAFTGDSSIAYFTRRTNTKLRAHMGNAYRAPALYERFGTGFYNDPANGAVFFSPYGDPRLAPDRYNSVDTGVDQYLFANRVMLSATFFYTRIVNVSAFDFSGTIVNPATDPYGRSSGYYNGSGGISRGTEFVVKARPVRSLTLSGAYTYTNADTDADMAVPGFYRALGVPRHVTTAVATKQWNRRLDTTVDFYRYSSIAAAFFTNSGDRAFLFPGFSKTGLASSYRFWDAEARSARLYARVDNLLNRGYYESGFMAPRATFVVGLGYSF